MAKRYYYDEESDSLYICIGEGKEERFEEIVPGIHIEFDEKDEIIGVEILNASRFTEGVGKEKAAAR